LGAANVNNASQAASRPHTILGAYFWVALANPTNSSFQRTPKAANGNILVEEVAEINRSGGACAMAFVIDVIRGACQPSALCH